MFFLIVMLKIGGFETPSTAVARVELRRLESLGVFLFFSE